MTPHQCCDDTHCGKCLSRLLRAERLVRGFNTVLLNKEILPLDDIVKRSIVSGVLVC